MGHKPDQARTAGTSGNDAVGKLQPKCHEIEVDSPGSPKIYFRVSARETFRGVRGDNVARLLYDKHTLWKVQPMKGGKAGMEIYVPASRRVEGEVTVRTTEPQNFGSLRTVLSP